MFAGLNLHRQSGAVLVHQHDAVSAVCVLCGTNNNVARLIALYADTGRAGLECLAQVTDGVIMATLGERRIVLAGHIHRAEARVARAGTTVRAVVVIEHEIPYDDGLAPAGHVRQTGVFHLVQQRDAHVVAVVPCTDRGLSEIEVLLRSGLVYSLQFGSRTAVVMVGSAVDILGSVSVVVNLDRVAVLVLLAVVVVVVVKDDDFCLQSRSLEGRTERGLDDI